MSRSVPQTLLRSGRCPACGHVLSARDLVPVFSWLFQTRTGVLSLLGGGVLIFFVISAVLEVRTRARYKNHEKSPDDWDLFDDESGWSDFEDDNH